MESASNITTPQSLLRPHEVFQTGLMAQLLDGVYEGEMTVEELLTHGDFGIGTFNGLDGEMIILDGQCYQMRHDGSISPAQMHQKTPFAVVTHFNPVIKRDLPHNILRRSAAQVLDDFTVSQNYMYAIKIVGSFEWVRTRTVIKQSKPYPKMVEATENEDIVQFDHCEGTIVGFRTPIYEQGIGVPGCHAHFIENSYQAGGHVVDFKLKEAHVEICPGTSLKLQLPLTPEFSQANLSPEDLAEQISKAEKHSS
ncbi:acetolactate decarboxylase [Rothia sp. P13129]|uniref:acetolactate decarboxylase n=1 Tax=Rothia sp. P13129 TaxID=3402664 RepID=UPI003ACC7C6F